MGCLGSLWPTLIVCTWFIAQVIFVFVLKTRSHALQLKLEYKFERSNYFEFEQHQTSITVSWTNRLLNLRTSQTLPQELLLNTLPCTKRTSQGNESYVLALCEVHKFWKSQFWHFSGFKSRSIYNSQPQQRQLSYRNNRSTEFLEMNAILLDISV